MIILIDSSILGQLCNPTLTKDLPELERWFVRSLTRSTVVSSMICDYEVRRELLLAHKRGAIASGLPILDDLHQLFEDLMFAVNIAFLILHTGFQTDPVKNVPFRMADYYLRLKRKYPQINNLSIDRIEAIGEDLLDFNSIEPI